MPGGKRKGAGRPKGAPNKATAEVREVAQGYTEEAVESLASIMRDEAQPAAARVAASRELLDRAHGRAKQSVDLGGEVAYTIQTAVPRDPTDLPLDHDNE